MLQPYFFRKRSKLVNIQHIFHGVFTSAELAESILSCQLPHGDYLIKPCSKPLFLFIHYQRLKLTKKAKIQTRPSSINSRLFFVLNNIIKMEEAKQIVANLGSFSFTEYCESGSVEYALAFTLALGTLCFILTKVTSEMSWVDRIWSLLPILYQAHYIYHQSHCRGIEISNRQWLVFSFTCAWGIRLTYNFYRKGGYQAGGEDYRWAYIRQNYHWILVETLNIVFTAYYQLVLILWFSSPIREAYTGELNSYDYGLAALWLLLFAGEVTADQQQWNFQTEKYRLLKANGNQLEKLPERFRAGFLTDGLFSISRHPNFFCEISLWYVQYFFSHNSCGLNWSGLGAVLLHSLFLGSTTLTEIISGKKYPKYEQYQKTTSMLIPCPSRKPTKKD